VAHSSNYRSRLLAGAIACAFALPVAAKPAEDGYNRFIVRFKSESVEHRSLNARQRLLDSVGRGEGVHLGLQRRLAVGADLFVTDHKLDHAHAKALLARLARDPNVAYVDFDRRMHKTLTPNDTYYSNQWHYFNATSSIRADVAWDTATGNGIVVAVIDTGITSHPDLNANIIAGYDFISDTATANDGGGRDNDPSDPGDYVAADECGAGEPAENSSWHGTHVAGTVAALTNNNAGVAGVAFNAKVQPLRVLGKCGGWTSDIADAIVWASGGTVPGVPANATPAEVVNMSLGGGGGCDPLTQDAVNLAVANGTVVIVAAGNENDDAANHSPASCQNVVTVGAVGKTGKRASYSNYGSHVDVSAPGGDMANYVYSTVNAGTTVPGAAAYAGYQGTSMATPHVAGVAAMLQSMQVNSPALIETILKGTTRAFTCTLGCGTGMVDAPNALAALNTPFLYIDDATAVLEGNSGTKTMTFTVRLSEAVGSAVTFNIATANGTATSGSDYVAQSLTNQSIPAGMLSKTFTVTVNGDATTEADETVLVNVSSVAGGVTTVLDSQATGTIVNDEAIALTNGVALTGLSAALNTVTLYKLDVPAGATNLTFQTTGSAAEDADIYVAANMSPTQKVDCTSAGVDTNELCSIPAPEAGTYYLQLVAYTAYSNLSLVGSYTPPAAGGSLSVDDVTITEGNSGTKTANFTVTLSQAAAFPITFDIATAAGSATAGSDYVTKSTVGESIAAGQTTKTFAVTINGDTTNEPDETFTVNLSNASGATIADGQGTGTITNDDGPMLSVGDVAITEGDSGAKLATFTVSLSTAAAGAVTYDIATGGGTATADGDYVSKASVGESIAAGVLSKTFVVTLNGDTTVEANETFDVTLSNVSGAGVADATGTGTILNDDGPSLSITDATIAEGNSGTKVMTWTVKLSQAAAVPVTYDIATANANATAGSDYVANSATGETIPAGQLSRTFSATINGDTTIEANEVFYVNLSNASGATIQDSQGFGLIYNDDGPTISVADIATVEGDSGTKVVTYTITLSQAAAVPVTYDVATADGPGATGGRAGTDYVSKSLQGETIPAGMLSKTFTVTLNGDTTVEPNELVWINISNATGATIFDSQANVYVVNDDGPTLVISDANVTEGNSGTKLMTFTVSLTQAATVPVSYNVSTGNGSAVGGSDFVALALTGQTIPTGMLSKTFSVTINGDTTVEGNEIFTATLTASNGATIRDATGLGMITNDD
jgi:serine protease